MARFTSPTKTATSPSWSWVRRVKRLPNLPWREQQLPRPCSPMGRCSFKRKRCCMPSVHADKWHALRYSEGRAEAPPTGHLQQNRQGRDGGRDGGDSVEETEVTVYKTPFLAPV